jgi:phenylacetate-coenzyme A ligase PaaK-like adenylate-forming protein
MTAPSIAPADPRTLAGELIARSSWTQQQLAGHQRKRLTALLRHAAKASAYYRHALGPDPADVPLQQLPTLPKSTLMEHFDDIITDPWLRRNELEAHLAGPDAMRPLGGYRVLTTSGSTGRRGIFVYSRGEIVTAVAGLLRTLAACGISPETRVTGIGSPSELHISRHLVDGMSAGHGPEAPRLSVITPIPQMVQALNAYRPEAVVTHASIAALLAEESLAGRLRITPRILASTGEVLAADMRARIREAWGIEPHEFYATTETGVLASTGPAHAGLHVWEDLFVVEIVDAANRPVPPGIPGDKVLVTNLVNQVQPLIRYEISDTVTLAGGTDPTSWPFRRIAAIDGRADDFLELPAPGGTVTVHPLHLRAPFVTFPDVVQYQVIHDEHGLSVPVVLRPSAPGDLPRRVAAALAQRLAQVGALPPPITVTPVTHIDHEGGIAAKFKIVKSRLPPR